MRVLYVLQYYPALSETYIEVERRQVAERAETYAVGFTEPPSFTPEHMPHETLSSILPSKLQSRWGWGLTGLARDYAPDVVHAHWLFVSRFAQKAARACDVPWTMRTHSFDILEMPLEKVRADLERCNEADCAAVLAFPFLRPALLEAGLKEEKIIDVPPVVDALMFDDLSPNGSGLLNMGAAKPKKNFEGYIRLSALMPDRAFSLYPMSSGWQNYRATNDDMGGCVDVRSPVFHSEMPAIYKQSEWLIYTGCRERASNGWPLSVCEAWASGVGVCLQRVRDDMDDYIGDCGYLFDDIEEVPALIATPPDQEMRERAHSRALEFDIRNHMHGLYDAWAQAGVTV